MPLPQTARLRQQREKLSDNARMNDPHSTTHRPTLLLVDGSSYLYRAFFAGGESMSVTLADGMEQKTGAIRIVINMMQNVSHVISSRIKARF